ncbi:hypothetical protein NQ315_005256 [Exocentrus adspersus]|uniref:Uncharacterized protein n=1 Tax=Exocentrus adspersus TaxID=1586481 RepID=A0AAV8W2W0_9CUCU|nr:hypothetical protein NQ315_005256 [Exocentrus adspersus]
MDKFPMIMEVSSLNREFHKQSEELTQRMFNLNTYEQNENVEAVINKTFEVHDSLIEYLGKHGTVEDAIKSLSDIEEKHNEGQILGVKHPKNENQMIEELKILSVQLKNTVKCLVAELDDRNKEIEGLKERIKVLESEKTAESKSSGVKVEAISPGVTSPFVFSPGSELSPDINQQSIILPPLEMPNLDFLKLYKSSSNEDSTK